MTEERIAQVSRDAAAAAQPHLDQITENIIKRNQLDGVSPNQREMVRVGLALNEMQHESFSLGVRVGMNVLIELMQESENAKRSNAGKEPA